MAPPPRAGRLAKPASLGATHRRCPQPCATSGENIITVQTERPCTCVHLSGIFVHQRNQLGVDVLGERVHAVPPLAHVPHHLAQNAARSPPQATPHLAHPKALLTPTAKAAYALTRSRACKPCPSPCVVAQEEASVPHDSFIDPSVAMATRARAFFLRSECVL